MSQKRRRVSQTKNLSTNKTTKIYQSKGQYDTSKYLALGGIIGLILFYIVVSRALNTGSYWEYFYSLIIITISIRLFIRSIRLK